jgi:hypothetical protein
MERKTELGTGMHFFPFFRLISNAVSDILPINY